MSDKKAVEVKRIVIRLGDKEVSLSPDEAKELKNILKEMFGEEKTTYIPYPSPVIYPYPYYPWPQPYVGTYWGVTYSTDGTVYCAANT